MPTGWSLLGLRVVNSLASAAEDLITLVPKLATLPLSTSKKVLTAGKIVHNVADKVIQRDQNDVSQNKVSFSTCTIGLDGSGRKTNNAVRIFSVKEKMALGLLAGEDFVKALNKFKENIVNTENPEDITADMTILHHISTFLDLVEEPFNAKGVQDDIKIPVHTLIKRVRNTASEIR